MLVSFTGAQSSGKTTLLRYFLEEHQWGSVDEVTRRIRRVGFEINDDGSNYNDTQLAIFADHIQNLFAYSGKEMNNILDRCLVDGYIYTRYFRTQGKVNEFVDKMFSYALGKYIERYDCIFYTNPYDVPLINDGERSTSESFRSKIIKLYEELILNKYPNVYILEGSIESRYNKMVEIIEDVKTR
jgi:nicotinamide riboside kinase